MGIDRRLSRLAHGLIHMSQHEGVATSQSIAKMFGTNPVVVRRMMAGLRKDGIVGSQKGHGGGWMLTKKLENISLLDIHQALGNSNLVSINLTNEQPQCLVVQAVNDALEKSIIEAKTLLYKRFAEISLADIAGSFENKKQNLTENQKTALCPSSQS
ncbi:MAG: Rrf2 family transcriptional regulator [Alphaproteobacteria bacterium]|nr:Rrf2 family transcriptional regulator [Alphaproteobacteria bacterium]